MRGEVGIRRWVSIVQHGERERQWVGLSWMGGEELRIGMGLLQCSDRSCFIEKVGGCGRG